MACALDTGLHGSLVILISSFHFFFLFGVGGMAVADIKTAFAPVFGVAELRVFCPPCTTHVIDVWILSALAEGAAKPHDYHFLFFSPSFTLRSRREWNRDTNKNENKNRNETAACYVTCVPCRQPWAADDASR